MPIPWQAVGDYLAPIALGGAGAFATFIALLPSKLGERLVGHYFDKRIADLKHEQSVELGKLQANLDHLKDRGVRSNEREYVAISQTWELFVEAYRSASSAVVQFYSYPDLDLMSDEDLRSFLAVNELPGISQAYILKATDKKRAFSNHLRNKSVNDAATAIEATRDSLFKQSVFIPADLHAKFEQALTLIHRSQIEQRMTRDHGPGAGQEASLALIDKEGSEMFNALRDAVRGRLLRTA